MALPTFTPGMPSSSRNDLRLPSLKIRLKHCPRHGNHAAIRDAPENPHMNSVRKPRHRFLSCCAGLSLVLVSLALVSARPDEEDDESQLAAELAEYGGGAVRDDTLPGRPVFPVNFGAR